MTAWFNNLYLIAASLNVFVACVDLLYPDLKPKAPRWMYPFGFGFWLAEGAVSLAGLRWEVTVLLFLSSLLNFILWRRNAWRRKRDRLKHRH